MNKKIKQERLNQIEEIKHESFGNGCLDDLTVKNCLFKIETRKKITRKVD